MKKKEQHKQHLNIKTVNNVILPRLASKRDISEEDLSAVLAECAEIREANLEERPGHSDECSYYMKCGADCRCGYTSIQIQPIPVETKDVLTTVMDDMSVLTRDNPHGLDESDRIVDNMVKITDALIYAKSVVAANKVSQMCDELPMARKIFETFPYVPIGVKRIVDRVGLYERKGNILLPTHTVRFLRPSEDNSYHDCNRPPPEDSFPLTHHGTHMSYIHHGNVYGYNPALCDCIDLVILGCWYRRLVEFWLDRYPDWFHEIDPTPFGRCGRVIVEYPLDRSSPVRVRKKTTGNLGGRAIEKVLGGLEKLYI